MLEFSVSITHTVPDPPSSITSITQKMSLSKRRRVSEDTNDAESSSAVSHSDDEQQIQDVDSDASSSQKDEEDISGDESPDTEEEIESTQRQMKSKKTQKRKRRATSPSQFGATLQSLLNTNAPSNLPLALKPSVAKRRADEVLEVKAKKSFWMGRRRTKKKKNHISDVIGGWGGESERSLRKVAQRGGLFRCI